MKGRRIEMTVTVIVQLKTTDRTAHDRYQASSSSMCSGNSAGGCCRPMNKTLSHARPWTERLSRLVKSASPPRRRQYGIAEVKRHERRRRVVIGPVVVGRKIGPGRRAIGKKRGMSITTPRAEVGCFQRLRLLQRGRRWPCGSRIDHG